MIPATPALRQARFALVGNPNVGKTSLFNALTGLTARVGNYSGVTVEKKIGKVELPNGLAEVVDLPGIYTLSPHSPDEVVAFSVLTSSAFDLPLDGLLVLLDASNLERNLYLFSQVLALGLPTIVALNMLDVAGEQQLVIDVPRLQERLGVPVVVINAAKKTGLAALRQAMDALIQNPTVPLTMKPDLGTPLIQACESLQTWLETEGHAPWPSFMLERALIDQDGHMERAFHAQFGLQGKTRLSEARLRIDAQPMLAAHEARSRYAWVHACLTDGVLKRPQERVNTLSDKLDALLTHRVWGFLIFGLIMALMFQSIYTWSTPMMNGIGFLFKQLGLLVGHFLPEGAFKSLLVDGVIAGLGAVIQFLPQIAILFMFIGLLEDCGYMARAAFLMDRIMGKAGLSGKSFIPMLSGFACAVPSIMATRTIENRRDRLATILALPLMSCSARLPVYMIMIGAFIPPLGLYGLDLRGLVLFGIYTLGVGVAIPMIWLMKRSILRGATPAILLELPSYKAPSVPVVLQRVWQQSSSFLERAGSIILFVTVLVWAGAYFPHSGAIAKQFESARQAIATTAPPTQRAKLDAQEGAAYIEDSYLARFGKGLEPLFSPLGWDWRITTGVLASFPAREVIVSTMGTLYSLGDDAQDTSLGAALKNSKRPDGKPEFTVGVALSVMVFFALCLQCASTLAVMLRETGSWKWPAFAFVSQSCLAYIGALLTYQLTKGW
jgi:ferrous iron transport protein B